LEHTIDYEYGRFLELVETIRDPLAAHYPDFERRKALWYQLVDSDVLDLLRQGDEPGARRRIVGAGLGDPGLITVRGLECLRQADAVIYDRLVNNVLLDEAPAWAEQIFVGKAPGAHTCRQEQINALIIERARAGQVVVRLKGGDPFVFGRGGEEARACTAAGVRWEVVPGVTSAVSVLVCAGIPATIVIGEVVRLRETLHHSKSIEQLVVSQIDLLSTSQL
jgi:precorrin-4 methylase